MLNDRDLRLARDETSVGGAHRLRTLIRRVDVAKPPASESSVARVHDRAKPDVACLREQYRTQRDLELVHTGTRARDVGEAVHHPGPGEDLEQHLGKIDSGHHARHLPSLRCESGRLGRRAETLEPDPAILDHGLTIGVGELVFDLPVGVIERDRQRLKMRVGLGGQVECLEHSRPGALPPLPVQQPRARITPPIGAPQRRSHGAADSGEAARAHRRYTRDDRHPPPGTRGLRTPAAATSPSPASRRVHRLGPAAGRPAPASAAAHPERARGRRPRRARRALAARETRSPSRSA